MARISAEEKKDKKNRIDTIIVRIFLEEGWSAVTYDRLAKEFGVRKSSIQAYYPTSIMFATALQGKVLPMFVEKLDLTTKEGFISSWLNAYDDQDNHVFREVIEMLLHNILKDGTSPHARGSVMRLQQQVAINIGEEEAVNAIKIIFGEMMYRKMHQ